MSIIPQQKMSQQMENDGSEIEDYPRVNTEFEFSLAP